MQFTVVFGFFAGEDPGVDDRFGVVVYIEADGVLGADDEFVVACIGCEERSLAK